MPIWDQPVGCHALGEWEGGGQTAPSWNPHYPIARGAGDLRQRREMHLEFEVFLSRFSKRYCANQGSLQT